MPSDAPLTQAEYDAIVEPHRQAHRLQSARLGGGAIGLSDVLKLDDYIHWLRYELSVRDKEIAELKVNNGS